MKNEKRFDLKVIGNRLKSVREELRLTINGIREITGISKSHISEMENGIKRASLKYLVALAENFNVNINWLLTGRGNMFKAGIELNMDFGTEDNKLIEEMIFYLNNANIVRHDLMRYFIQYKRENREILKDYIMSESGN